MNNINDITAQNILDCWSILYKNLARSLITERGNDGKIVVRKANHLFGIKMGELERANHLCEGQLTNLKTLFTASQANFPDPRYRIQWQLFSEQEAVFDVITCPIFDNLKESGDLDLILAFCEEYHLGCIEGYTHHSGQCCLSEHFIFHGENSCRLGCYFRASNISRDERPFCFSDTYSQNATPPVDGASCSNPKTFYSLWAQLLLDAYISECTSRYGAEATYIISDGLKSAASETAEYLTYRSNCTNQKLDQTYITNNTFWGVDLENITDISDDMRTMIHINYCCVLGKLLTTHWK